MFDSLWRDDFPALHHLQERGVTWLDSAATAQKPAQVISCLQHWYSQGAANVHRAPHLPGEQATSAYEQARTAVADWLHVNADEILFTRNATESFNLLAYALEHSLTPGSHIAVSALEHHANLLPWQQLVARRNLRLDILPLTPQGKVDLDTASRLIGPHTAVLAISQLSNVFGTWQPLDELLDMARRNGALTVVDGAQGIAHCHPDLLLMDCDFYAFSGHKLYAPEGIGVLYARRSAAARLQHWQFGGEMLEWADYHSARFRTAPQGFEAGTPPIGPAMALGAAVDYLRKLDHKAVTAHENNLLQQALEFLWGIPGVHVLGDPQCALASFTVEGIHPADLGALLAEQGVAVRTGQHCCMPLFRHLQLPGAVRLSLSLYNNSDDLQRFFVGLRKALDILG